MLSKQNIGKYGEEIATNYLKKMKYIIITRNFRCRSGEIDIIAKDKNEIVFVEVKTRSNLLCGVPSEAVDERKRKHIYRTAQYYLYKFKLNNVFVRFDIVEIIIDSNKCKISHLKNISILD